MLNEYYLAPTNGRKSFYGKARVRTEKGVEILRSYTTDVAARYRGKVFRLWDDWSATTGAHIAAFCGLSKKQFTALPLVSLAELGVE